MIEILEPDYIDGKGTCWIRGDDVKHDREIREAGIALMMGWA